MTDKPKAARGFAVMTPDQKRQIASMGGKAAHRSGNAHQFTSEEARAAGSKRHANRRQALATGQDAVDDVAK